VARVTVEPAALTFEVGPDENLLAGALKAGIRWPTVCKGVGTCKTCYFLVKAGTENFSPLSQLEKDELIWVRKRHADVPLEHVRLACQTTVTGDVTVSCKGARPPVVQESAAG
jgi:ferredoxin